MLFSLAVFGILTLTMFLVGAMYFLLMHSGVLEGWLHPMMTVPMLSAALSSIVMGTIVAAVVSRIPLKPVKRLLDGLNELAAGNYHVQLELTWPPIGRDIVESFNKLAEELRATEMLRSDFANNFSHEFKTPIVSIRGFAKLLQKGNLPEERRKEYLAIIVDESTRLADMATNVLNLAKVENQSILTDVTRYNLSEQMRNCILLFEKKWSEKELTIDANFGEVEINANEELCMQIWINLLDNAVKFADTGSEIGVTIVKSAREVTVSIRNRGESIPENDKTRIFRKFYQCDTSHATEGTGIGLAIVSRIVDLHHGRVRVESAAGRTVFTVMIPTQ
ncbi:MAG: HAMP domain-containing sensor histidine kinase [Clostridiaceae bacterium]|nr:HAMP domain-containing sensor histidine kinase [Clostridiaceae bacterium]